MDALPGIDGLVHEPARLRVLALLAVLERADFMYLLRRTGISRGNLFVQLGKLQEAGLVTVERSLEGRRRRSTYALTREGGRRLQEYRAAMLQILDGFADLTRG